jgi:hypothetical protein
MMIRSMLSCSLPLRGLLQTTSGNEHESKDMRTNASLRLCLLPLRGLLQTTSGNKHNSKDNECDCNECECNGKWRM